MRTYDISFSGNAPERWTHFAAVTDSSSQFPTFNSYEIDGLSKLVKVGQSARLFDGTRATLVEA